MKLFPILLLADMLSVSGWAADKKAEPNSSGLVKRVEAGDLGDRSDIRPHEGLGEGEVVHVMGDDGKIEEKTLKQYTKELYAEAEQGNFDAQLMLGVYWLFGHRGFVKNEKKAYEIFSKLAKTNQGNTGPAEYYLGICYFFGAGVDKDEDEAFKWLSLSAKAGGDEADCGLGVCYFLGSGVEEDKKEAFKCFARSAEKRNENGLSCLGYCYLKGSGVKKDEAKAIECFKQSILHNPDFHDLKAVQTLSPHRERRIKNLFVVECLSGSEVKEESSEFVKWLEISDENMSPIVQLFLGDCYSSGNGAIQDQSKALQWWIRAGEHGNAEAQCNIGEYYNWRAIKKSDDGKTFYPFSKNLSDKKESIKWFRMAAEQGNATAQYRLYQELLHGEMASDKGEAIKWLKSAASQGDPGIGYELGEYYLNEGKNEKDGLKLIMKSANDGYYRAQSFLAKGYASGDILPKDPGMALIWCQKASEQGDSDAKKMLPQVKAEADADRILKKIESKN
jgi:uncharacterized protein